MTNFVLDASALVALIRKETGWEEVENYIPNSLISAVNFSETIYILRRREMPLEAIRAALTPLVSTPAVFDSELAYRTASVVEATRGQGISFADCACPGFGTVDRCNSGDCRAALGSSGVRHQNKADSMMKQISLPPPKQFAQSSCLGIPISRSTATSLFD